MAAPAPEALDLARRHGPSGRDCFHVAVTCRESAPPIIAAEIRRRGA